MPLTEEEADKLRYSTDSNGNVSYSGSVGITAFKKPETVEDELAFYGFSTSEIENIVNKFNAVSDSSSTVDPVTTTNPATGETSTNVNGSLLSNSAKAFKANSDYQKARLETEKLKITAINESNRIAQAQLIATLDSNRTKEATLIMLGEQYLQTDRLIDAIKNQKLTTGTINVNPSVHVDTTAIAQSTKTIADATVALSESATVQKEHYDFLKNGSESLKDSKGNAIVPREISAKNNAENHIYKNAENTHDHQASMLEVLNHLNGMSNVGNGSGNGSGSGDSNDDLLSVLDRLVSFDYEKWKNEHNFTVFKENT